MTEVWDGATSPVQEVSLAMPEECSIALEREYRNATLIVEYGMGGSTALAASMGKDVLSVESSAEFCSKTMGEIQSKRYAGHVTPLWCDIGPTIEWGFPQSDGRRDNWPSYAISPWAYCQERSLIPDVVLIDGRFRVACFIATAFMIEKPTTVIFDDFRWRPQYSKVLDIAEPDETIDRMAVFKMEPGRVRNCAMLSAIRYFSDPR